MKKIRDELLRSGAAATPSYVYDVSEVERRCAWLEDLPIERKSIFFATMANDHHDILRVIQQRSHGVFVNSRRHLEIALQAGFPPSRIIYAATNMQRDEIVACTRQGVRIILDSLGQVKSFAAAIEGGEIGIRLSVGSALDGAALREDPQYRFGLLPEEIPEALVVTRAGGVRIVGVHSYFGTDLADYRILIQGLRRLLDRAAELPDVRFIDVGGGFGASDERGAEFDFAAYGREAAAALRDFEQNHHRPLELVMEPGRYLVASCGYFVVRVVDVKPRVDRIFVGTNGSVAIFPRPLIYPERAAHPCEILGSADRGPVADKPIFVCGNSTYSRDFIASNVRMPVPEPGDLLALHLAGAYCRSMITEFLGKDRPTEFVVAGSS